MSIDCRHGEDESGEHLFASCETWTNNVSAFEGAEFLWAFLRAIQMLLQIWENFKY